jgi:hypothetical protein
MEYNTQREPLLLSEYGRSVQKMVDFINTFPDKATRTKAANAIVHAMMTVQSGPRDMIDYKRKLWDHLHVIGNFSLDIDAPFPMPKPDEKISPEWLSYSIPHEVRFRFYGRYTEKIVKKAIEMEEGSRKKELVGAIANTMKKLYLTWNKDSVKDELILEQLKLLSDGKLSVEPDFVFQDTAEIVRSNKVETKTWSQNNNKKNRKNNKFKKKY